LFLFLIMTIGRRAPRISREPWLVLPSFLGAIGARRVGVVAFASRAYEAAISPMDRVGYFQHCDSVFWGAMEPGSCRHASRHGAGRDGQGSASLSEEERKRERWKDLCKCDTPHTTSQCSPEQVRINGTAATLTGCFTFTGGGGANTN
jgi:hypothetical protein